MGIVFDDSKVSDDEAGRTPLVRIEAMIEIIANDGGLSRRWWRAGQLCRLVRFPLTAKA
jgi:hypothetical protein